MSSKFVFSKKDIQHNHLNVKENEIGILENKTHNGFEILFITINQKIVLQENEFDFVDIKKIGDSFQSKICNVCHRLLPTDEFSKNQNGKNNRTIRRPSCNDCRKTIDGLPAKPSYRKNWIKIKPHLSPFNCPICEKTTIPGLTSKVVLDHDHLSGKIRGWICDSCNTGIGRFKDDIELLKKAIHFLEINKE